MPIRISMRAVIHVVLHSLIVISHMCVRRTTPLESNALLIFSISLSKGECERRNKEEKYHRNEKRYRSKICRKKTIFLF